MKKRNLDRDDHEEWDSSRDGSRSPPRTRTCRESDANSPGREDAYKQAHGYPQAMDTTSPGSRALAYKQQHGYYETMDTDSPASYPKHVIVPSPPDSNDRMMDGHSRPLYPGNYYVGGSPAMASKLSDKVVTPIRSDKPVGMHGGYDGHFTYSNPQQGQYYHSDAYGRPYHAPQQVPPPLDGPYNQHHGSHEQVQLRPKRWACDYCCVATFLTYEDACAHEETCSRSAPSHGHHSHGPPHHHFSPPPQYPGPNMGGFNSGLGALYQATQQVQHRGPPMPANDNMGYPSLTPRFQQYNQHHERHEQEPVRGHQHRILLQRPTDVDSLSDRQCFVRSEFVEVFAATEKDVSSRHSKGAQKLAKGQVGIRCIHCAHLRSKDRAERAVCYPSSISRIYQTVADMQRFHFEQCREIPDKTRQIYKNLKTTRPRGVGSPQTYWMQSAKLLGMVDTEDGIRFGSGEHSED